MFIYVSTDVVCEQCVVLGLRLFTYRRGLVLSAAPETRLLGGANLLVDVSSQSEAVIVFVQVTELIDNKMTCRSH